eukprot:7385869-Prymnesium_polylepis.1
MSTSSSETLMSSKRLRSAIVRIKCSSSDGCSWSNEEMRAAVDIAGCWVRLGCRGACTHHARH